MLAAIEIGRLDDIIDCKPAYAIYFGYVAHVERASYIGVPYSERIPQYVLDNQGAPVLVRRTNALLSLMAIVRSSKVLRRLDRTVANALEGASIGQDDVDMYIKIVDRARQILESGYPGVEFHVIFWDEKGKEPSEYIIRNLIDRGIKVHLISWIFPNYDYNTMKYRLGPEYMVNEVTWHINGKGYTKIADYIASSIVD